MSGIEALKKWREAGGAKEPPKTPWEKLALRPKSMRAAITAKCHECMGWGPDEGRPAGIRSDMATCTAVRCPLHGLRPYLK